MKVFIEYYFLVSNNLLMCSWFVASCLIVLSLNINHKILLTVWPEIKYTEKLCTYCVSVWRAFLGTLTFSNMYRVKEFLVTKYFQFFTLLPCHFNYLWYNNTFACSNLFCFIAPSCSLHLCWHSFSLRMFTTVFWF